MIVASAPGSWHGAQRGQGGSAPWPWSGPGGTVSCGRTRGACPSICGRPLGPLSGESAARCHGADAPRPQTVGRHVASAFVFAEGGLAALTSAALSTRFLLRKCRVPAKGNHACGRANREERRPKGVFLSALESSVAAGGADPRSGPAVRLQRCPSLRARARPRGPRPASCARDQGAPDCLSPGGWPAPRILTSENEKRARVWRHRRVQGSRAPHPWSRPALGARGGAFKIVND